MPALQMLSMPSQSNNAFAPAASVNGSAASAPTSASVLANKVKVEPQSSSVPQQQQQQGAAVAAFQQVPSTMNGNITAAPVQNAQALPLAAPIENALTASVAPTVPIPPQMLTQMQAKPVQSMTNISNPKLLGKPPNASNAAGASPGTVRNGNGGGGQLLQFPWKLHEMLHLAEKNGKTSIISWLPGGNGFKVHNKEKFCAEIMPGYFASQKYKTFQRSLNLWGFESVAKGPDRGACYHQYFVKGHPELCHSMTRVKIKGQSNPRTPAAAAAAAAAAAKRAAMGAAMTAALSANQQHNLQSQQAAQGIMTQQQQIVAQQQQPLNIFAMNQFLPGANMGMPHMAMQVAGGNQAMAGVAANPYALAMNNLATMNALQQFNPALAAAAMQNPAMSTLIAAQVMAAAANNNPVSQQARVMAAAQQQQQPVPVTAQRQGVGPVPAAPAMAPGPVNTAFAPGVSAQQQQQQLQQQQQSLQQQLQLQQQQLRQQQQQQQQGGIAPVAPTPAAPASIKTESGIQGQMPLPSATGPAFSASPAASTNANANFAEFLARKANMDLQQQQAMLSATNAPGNGSAPGNMPMATKPLPATPGNVPTPDVNNYGGADGVVSV